MLLLYGYDESSCHVANRVPPALFLFEILLYDLIDWATVLEPLTILVLLEK